MSDNLIRNSWRERLTGTEWASLSHAYGDAEDVPGWLEGVTDSATVEESVQELWAAVLHQGTIYDSTPPAMEVLGSMLGARTTANPDLVAWLLSMYSLSVEQYAAVEDLDADMMALVRDAQSSLATIAESVRPLVALDVSEAGVAALLVGAVGHADDDTVSALVARASRRPAGAVEWTCMATLVRLGCDVSALLADGDPGMVMAATLARIAGGSTEQPVVEALIADWALAVEVAPVTAVGVEDVAEWLSAVNPTAATRVFEALPSADEPTVNALVDVVLTSRSNAPDAIRRLLAFAAMPDSNPALMIHALRQLPPSEEVRDALVAVADRVQGGYRAQIGSSTHEADARADAALALLRSGDDRWSTLLARALVTNPAARALMVAASVNGVMGLGYAFARERSSGTVPLVEGIRRALRQAIPAESKSDGAGSLIDWIGTWPVHLASAAIPDLRALLPEKPRAVAGALAAWNDTDSIELLREAAQGGDAIVLLSLARLTKNISDFHRVLEADLEYVESEVLAHWGDRSDARFLDWCRDLVGSEPAGSVPGRENQVTALCCLADSSIEEAVQRWPVLRGIIDGGRGPIVEAINLATTWHTSNLLPASARDDLESLLADLVVTGRKNWSGPDYKVSAQAALGMLELGLPLSATPARITKIVTGAVDDRWTRETGIHLAERCATADAPVRTALVKKLRLLVDRDERFDSTGDPAIEDEHALARLRTVITRLEEA
ncbi:hypothetical protein [Mycolicibacterium frederiksbergense]|nr:hypothetical protein [Mycolicibacterium frederiksbergense]